MSMDPPPKPTTSLFDVYLRLRPSFAPNADRFLDVDEPLEKHTPTHITIRPPQHDQRKRAVETFTFTKVFEEEATQLELFHGTGMGPMLQGVLGPEGREGRDGLMATLGVTGSGKSHTILGSRSQRGLTQLALDVLYQNLNDRLVLTRRDPIAMQSLIASENSESQIIAANVFLESVYGDSTPETRGHSRGPSRAATPLMDVSFMSANRPSSVMGSGPRRHMPRLSSMPHFPVCQGIDLDVDQTAEFAIVVSMYEVYNDRIYDLLAGFASQQITKNQTVKRRHLLYKSTEQSPDRKVVAGLRKVVCENMDEALLVLETGLTERRVAGTGSNAVSSRSHGFFCVEVKKRLQGAAMGPWSSSTLTVVDLAGTERARAAKTAGQTLAEAGKINESLMYLGQCMQMQSDNTDLSKPNNIVPFRQCKLTELLFSNSFPSSSTSHHNTPSRNKPPQKAIMIVTADPLGDYNATSQILRYSALAREVSVSRIPSITSTIAPLPTPHPRPGTAASGRMTPSGRATPSGRSTPFQQASDDLEQALRALSQAREDLELTQIRLEEEMQRRMDAESSWLVTEQKLETLETELREEIWGELEKQMEMERRRWQAARDAEAERNEAHLDRKLELLTKGLGDVVVHEDEQTDSPDDRVTELEDENAMLREKLESLMREKENASPVRKMRVLKPRKWEGKEEFGLLSGSP